MHLPAHLECQLPIQHYALYASIALHMLGFLPSQLQACNNWVNTRVFSFVPGSLESVTGGAFILLSDRRHCKVYKMTRVTMQLLSHKQITESREKKVCISLQRPLQSKSHTDETWCRNRRQRETCKALANSKREREAAALSADSLFSLKVKGDLLCPDCVHNWKIQKALVCHPILDLDAAPFSTLQHKFLLTGYLLQAEGLPWAVGEWAVCALDMTILGRFSLTDILNSNQNPQSHLKPELFADIIALASDHVCYDHPSL